MESSPVFADPSGRRRQVLRFAGIGSMAVLTAFLVAVVMALTGGPEAPFTQWAGPQTPASAKHGGQVLTGGNSRSGSPRASSGSGGSVDPGVAAPGGAGTATTQPTSPSPSAALTPSPTAATPTATSRPAPHSHSSSHGNPHSTLSPTPTA